MKKDLEKVLFLALLFKSKRNYKFFSLTAVGTLALFREGFHPRILPEGGNFTTFSPLVLQTILKRDIIADKGTL